jgi:hypothetical protein
MPNVVSGADYVDPGAARAVAQAGYDYPAGLDLRPGSPLHQRIVSAVTERARASCGAMQPRHSSWRLIDRTLTAFVPLDDAERALKKTDPRKPVRIVVPVSFAALETLLTYMTTVFLERPYFRYEGSGPEDAIPAIMYEHVIDQQCQRLKNGLALHTFFRDAFAYGFGVIAPVWSRVMGQKSVWRTDGFWSMVQRFVPTTKKRSVVDYVMFEGNRLLNIDPYKYLPDPNVPLHDVQAGEFVGWLARENLMDLLARERDRESGLFNCRCLKGKPNRTSVTTRMDPDLERFGLGGAREPQAGNLTHPVDTIYMYVNLIPKDWGLGPREYPEKWLFAVAGDETVIQAQPLNLDHNLFPLAVAAPDYDGRSLMPISRLEVIYGMQETVDWLFASHIANVRKVLNDMIVYDPQLVNSYDLENPSEGKLIRLRPNAWGRGIKDAIQQLNTHDVTTQHIQDAMTLTELLRETSGATDIMQGIIRAKSGERRTAEEVKGARTSGLSRLQKTARVVGMQAMQDLGFMLASQTRQLMSAETWVKLSGRWQERLAAEYNMTSPYLLVRPDQLDANYDVVVNDGSSMAGMESVDAWLQVLQIITSNPLAAPQFDSARIIKHIARLTGAKNLEDFELKPMVLPDENVAGQLAAGNLVPAEQLEAAA